MFLVSFECIAFGIVLYDTNKTASDSMLTDSTKILKDTASLSKQPQIKPTLQINRTKNNSIQIDGRIDDDGWKNAAIAKDFVEINPRDNVEAAVKTEVLITYDDDNIYFAFINYETDIKSIRAHITDRDQCFTDDFCDIILDTYGESKQAYEIVVNPFGIQGDLFMDQSEGEDANYDLIFEAEAKIYKDRWIAEFKIPFKSLRFPDKEEQSWKVDLFRNRPRETREQISWVQVSRDIPSLLTQLGTITGIRDIHGGKNLEILPYGVASQSGYLNDNTDPGSGFVNEKVKFRGGVGLKYSFTSNLTGEATANPDFSQVESDAQQISANTSFALFYSEKRPFFLEGSNIFNTHYQFVYTRVLNDPLYAAKLIGKIGNIDVGYIGGYDIHTPFIVPFEEHSEVLSSDIHSFSNILRLKKSLKEESYLGLLATDRRIGSGYSSLVSFDGLLKFKKNYYFKWQLAGSSTRELNDTNLYKSSALFGNNHTESFDGEYFNGYSGFLDLERDARNWSFDLQYSDMSPEFRADNGFISRNDFRMLSLWQDYTFYTDKSKIFTSIIPQLYGDIRYNHEGKFKERFLNPEIQLNLKQQISIFAGYFVVNDEDYGGIFHQNVHRGAVTINAQPSGYVSCGAFLEIGKYIARLETPSFVGFGITGELSLTIHPTDRLSLENVYDYQELSYSYKGPKLFAGYVFRNKTIYQFSRNFYLRLITQYDSFSKTLEFDPLISYKLNAFTVFYIGSTHELTDFPNSSNASRFIQTNRQFFAKVQYLLRL